MDESPATQHVEVLPIFLEEDGRALPVFVEACSIVNRPKLVRTLKKAGAEICTDPRQARIILVDSRTYDGRRFIRDWGSDPNKVVLEYTWITKSCTAGRALMESDEWGGCLTQDDGLALDAGINMDDQDSQDELTNKSPLPTPRVTPIETATTKAKVRRKSQASIDVFETSTSTTNFTPESLSFQTSKLSSAQSSVPVHGNDIQIPSPSVLQYIPTIQQHQVTQHAGLMPQTMHTGTSQPNNFMHHKNNHLGMQDTPTQLTNFMQQQNMHPGMMSQMSMPMQFWAQMMGAMLSQSSPQPNPDLFAMSLIDAMRSYGMVPYPQTQSTVLNPQQITADNLSPQISLPPNAQPEIDVPSSSRSTTPQVIPSSSHKWNESASGYPPQVARRSGPLPRPHLPADSSALRPSPAKKQKRREQSTMNRQQTVTTSVPSRSLYNAETPTTPSQDAPSQKVFVADNREPITFFVQIDQPNRQNLVTLIKRNGGKIDSSQTSADYAVLYSQSKTFADLMKSANDAGKTTVGAPFIHDSIRDGVLQDPAKYKLKMLKRAKKRKFQQDSFSDIEELTVAEAEAETVSVTEQKKLPRNRWKQGWKKQEDGDSPQIVIKPEPEDVSLSFEQSRVPSPIPPSPSSDQFSTKGRAKYSDLEREYALKYIQVLLNRDHYTTLQTMANRLFQKMPHHTLKSWTSYISGYTLKEEVEDLRKQMMVARKKSLKQKQAQIVKEEPPNTSLEQVELNSLSQSNTEVVKKMNEEDDLNIIVYFFAYGGGDDQDEECNQEELWQRLSSKASCKTANSWTEFYEQHYDVIRERYTKLVKNIDAQPTILEPEILPAS